MLKCSGTARTRKLLPPLTLNALVETGVEERHQLGHQVPIGRALGQERPTPMSTLLSTDLHF